MGRFNYVVVGRRVVRVPAGSSPEVLAARAEARRRIELRILRRRLEYELQHTIIEAMVDADYTLDEIGRQFGCTGNAIQLRRSYRRQKEKGLLHAKVQPR